MSERKFDEPVVSTLVAPKESAARSERVYCSPSPVLVREESIGIAQTRTEWGDPNESDYERDLLEAGVASHHKSFGRNDAALSYGNISRAIDLYGPRSETKSRRLTKKHRRSDASSLLYMNPYAALQYAKATADAVIKAGLHHLPFYAITVLDRTWHANTDSFDINFDSISKDIHSGLKGLNYFANIEFAVFTNFKDHGAMLLAPHVQGIVWGELSDGRKRYHASQFSGGLNQSAGLYFAEGYDLSGSICYMTKGPFYGYKIRPRVGGGYFHKTTKLPYKTLYKLVQGFSHVEWPTVTLSGGEGRVVRKHLMRQVGWYE